MVDQYFQGNVQGQPQQSQQPQQAYAPQPQQAYAPQPQQTAPMPPQQPMPMASGPMRSDDSELTIGKWMLTLFLTMIPIVNLVMLFVWGFRSNTPLAKKNWAIANLIWCAIAIVAAVLLSVFGVFSMATLYRYGVIS